MTLEEKIWQKLDRAAIPGAWLTVIGDAIEDYRKEKDQQVAEALAALEHGLRAELFHTRGMHEAAMQMLATTREQLGLVAKEEGK